jgi:V/A-type H+-transporting ATPase subunit E
MRDKLQELTEKLYNEGLAKGQRTGEEIIDKAKQDAATIVANANNEAKSIIANAKKEAEELKSKVDSDIKMASVQTLSAIKQKIESEIIKMAVAEPVKEALTDKEFVQKIIGEAVKSFDSKSASAVSLEVLLPLSMKGDLEAYLKNAISKLFGNGFEMKFDKNLTSGFKVGPKDGSYHLSFTDKDFESLFSEYLRPATRKIVFDK